MKKTKTWMLAACLAALLAACGGGGGGGGIPVDPVSPVADLALSATVSDASVPAGGTTTLTVTVVNNGTDSARGVEMAADWGTGLAADPDFTCAATGGAVCPADADTGVVPDIPSGGRLVLTAPVTLKATARGAVSSELYVGASNDSRLDNNFASAVIQAYQADVSVSGRGPSTPVQAGSSTTYTMAVLNVGPDDARDVSVTNTLDASQTLGMMTCVAAGGATCPASPGASMRVPRLPKGGSLTFTVPVQVASGHSGSIGNTMTVSAAGDPQSNNNRAAVTASSYVAALPGQTSVSLQSDVGDSIGAGRTYSYTRANAVLSFTPNAATLHVQVAGDENWQGDFDLPNTLTQLTPGTYTGLTRAAFRNAAVGGLEWTGQGRGCNTLNGTITVNSVTYTGSALSAVDLSFEQHCEGAAAALRGQVIWIASDTTTPPGPVTPIPLALWSPPVGATPSSGNYVYLASDVGDYIGQGATSTLTTITTASSGGQLTVSGGGWFGTFQAMDSLAQLQPGYYADLMRYPFHNHVKGGLDWSGNGRGCNTLTGWFAVDSVAYDASGLAAVDLRFEQHCEGGTPSLHGKVHWVR